MIKSTKELIEELRLRMEESGITIEEVKENLPDVNPLLIDLLFTNNKSDFAEGFDKILSFANLNMRINNKKLFRPYYLVPTVGQPTISIYRKIEPRCSIRFDYRTGEFYRFRCDEGVSKGRQNLLKAEMRLIAEDYIENKKKNIRNIL